MIQMPYNAESEESVLGAMLLSDACVDQMAATLVASDFYSPAHGAIFGAITHLRAKGTKPDAVTVTATLAEQGLSDLVEPGLVLQLMANVPSVAAAPRYAEIMLGFTLRRRMVAEAQELLTKAQQLTEDPRALLEEHRSIMSTLGVGLVGEEPDDMSVEEFAVKFKERDPLAKWVVRGLLRKRHKLMVVGGESHGKSILTRYFAICAAYGVHPFRHTRERPIRVLQIDLENPEDALAESFEMILKPVQQEAGHVDTVNRFWWRPAGIDLRSRADLGQVENVIRARQPELVCLGPMYCAYETKPNENWETPARQVQTALKQLMVRYDFALILEDHPPQSDAAGKRQMRPYGSSLWRRWLDIGIGMEPLGDTVTAFHLNQWKKRVDMDWPERIDRGDSVGSPWPWVGTWRKL